MSTPTMTTKRTDTELDRAVTEELEWNPRVDDTGLAVSVKDGVVTLAGYVGNYGQKLAACDAAHRVGGVLDVIDEIEVRYTGVAKSDAELAKNVRQALEWDFYVPDRDIKSTVSEGRVRLEGEVEHAHQREDAARAIERLHGLRGITNAIRVKPKQVDSGLIHDAIQSALTRRAIREAKQVHVSVEGSTVKLTGVVHSWAEKNAIENVALFSSGVTKVDNDLVVNAFK